MPIKFSSVSLFSHTCKNVFPVINVYLVIFAGYILFTGYKFFGIDRSIVEALIIIACFIFFDRHCIFPLLLVLVVMAVHALNGNHFYYYDLANIPLILLFTKKIAVNRTQLNFIIFVQIIILIAFVSFNEIFGLYVDNMRNPGPFASSLHLSYFLICICFALFASNLNSFYLANFLCILLAIMSASRAAILFCYATYLIRLHRVRKILPFLYLILACVIYYYYGRRSLGLEAGNDDIRLMGYKNFFSSISFENLFFGLGRSEYGSVGIRVHGKENILITESSLLMLIYTQGVFLATFILSKLFNIINKILSSIPDGYLLLPFWAALFLLVPFFDSPSISVINLLTIKCIESAVYSNVK